MVWTWRARSAGSCDRQRIKHLNVAGMLDIGRDGTLVQRYASWMAFTRIVSEPGKMGGVPYIRGMGSRWRRSLRWWPMG